ncbi:PREDICTED: triose phosphate/phosphate translocator non-green [Prunus dulcis]|uniref:PREDICTED: triose phosphate/phosphate translocator non-green n=1 Tax=Prunus dulcis TaxID=3755 RepID=A0A5E4GB50_PRUDU|nr:hypothetical protein L3X38_034333 [Prunus dulcis]VVA36830.1 PREDICTED: triose phosphate/phosphate translocator non-green [Prunus dulcis]
MNGTLSASQPRRSWSFSSSSSNFKLRPWISVPLVDSDAGTSRFQVKATAESAEESSESSCMNKRLRSGVVWPLVFENRPRRLLGARRAPRVCVTGGSLIMIYVYVLVGLHIMGLLCFARDALGDKLI